MPPLPLPVIGSAVQEMRSYKEAEQAGIDAGLELLRSYDVATESSVSGAW